jgi:hypothetical protein
MPEPVVDDLMPIQDTNGIGLDHPVQIKTQNSIRGFESVGIIRIDKARPVNGRNAVPGWPPGMDLIKNTPP